MASMFVAPRVMGWTQQALNTLRNRQGRIAATQVDVVTHSMGGILARKHATGLTYQRYDNYQQGDFNKLVTFNTPHAGSPWANVVRDLLANPTYGWVVQWF